LGLSATTPKPSPNPTAGTGGGTPSRPIKTATGTDPRVDYCWTHGLVCSPEEFPHNSKTCRTKRPGHCDDATLFQRKGGSETIMINMSAARKRAKNDHFKERR
jgi:hypothetical protein